MNSVIQNDNSKVYGVNDYVCDTVADIASLPQKCKMGSTAFIIATSEVYMKNGEGKWVKI